MLDKIQLILSFQIIALCIFGGTTLLLRANKRRAKQILGWGMYLWAFLALMRVSVNWLLADDKEAFHPDVLIMGCVVTAMLASYVIEVLRPGYLTVKRFLLLVSPILTVGFMYLGYRLSGGEIHTFYSVKSVFESFDLDVALRMVIFLLMLGYMSLPVFLVIRYNDEYRRYLEEIVSDPDEYDLNWLKRVMIIMVSMYVLYLALLFTDIPLLYVINKVLLLLVWYYFFYKALFLKIIVSDSSFHKGWNMPYHQDDEDENNDDDEEQRHLLSQRYAEEVRIWFEKEKPYLRDDLRLTDLQRVFPMSRSYLSQLFNRDLGQSFSDYVNQFRVEECKRLMDAEPQTSLQEIAERSGFHSISTFRRAFQKYTGIIPSEYKRN